MTTLGFKALYLHKQVTRQSDMGTLTPTDNTTFNTTLNGIKPQGLLRSLETGLHN